MATYVKTSELDAAEALDGDELIEVVQGGDSLKATATQIKTFVKGTGIANTVTITGEHQFTEDNELDYTSSFTDGMAAATITFTELPADTVAILVLMSNAETGVNVDFQWKRSSGGTQVLRVRGQWADGGNNALMAPRWMLTDGNSIYVTEVIADLQSDFIILGYKTGS